MSPELVPLLREVGDLKRLTSAGRRGSIAERAFRRAWAELLSGRSAEAVALEATAACLAATRLGDLDEEALLPLGMSADEVAAVKRAALLELRPLLGDDRLSSLTAAVADHSRRHAEEPARRASRSTRDRGASFETRPPAAPQDDAGSGIHPRERGAALPPFISALAEQPRAGATCPGRARIVLLPAENHAEHCLVVAVYGVLLAEPGCDLGTVFLASLAHHLHNAAMPDAGFTGETLLGGHLEPLMRRATEAALAQLPPELAARTVAALRVLPDANTPEGRAFHAADVLDRVLEIEQHVRRGQVTMDEVLGPMALVHEGPVKPFHDRVLATMRLG